MRLRRNIRKKIEKFYPLHDNSYWKVLIMYSPNPALSSEQLQFKSFLMVMVMIIFHFSNICSSVSISKHVSGFNQIIWIWTHFWQWFSQKFTQIHKLLNHDILWIIDQAKTLQSLHFCCLTSCSHCSFLFISSVYIQFKYPLA